VVADADAGVLSFDEYPLVVMGVFPVLGCHTVVLLIDVNVMIKLQLLL
jgi:hypothetical protein